MEWGLNRLKISDVPNKTGNAGNYHFEFDAIIALA
jgi:hypothetical protein